MIRTQTDHTFFSLSKEHMICSNQVTHVTSATTHHFSTVSDFKAKESNVLADYFQKLSISESLQPLLPNEQRVWSVLIKKKKAELTQIDNAQVFKDNLIEILENFITRVDNEATKNFIKILQHDLMNKNLVEILVKYYQKTSPNLENTLLAELQPYLGDYSKIDALSQQEAITFSSKILNYFEPKAVNRDNLMAVLIHDRKKKYPDFTCYVVDRIDLSDCLKAIDNFRQENTPQRLQLLVRTDVHYTALDIQYKNGAFQAAVMDAAGDNACKEITAILEKMDFQCLYLLGLQDKIQYDSYNCAFFSFDSVCQSSKDLNFFNLLSQISQAKGHLIQKLNWKDLPPQFVRNATSTTFMKEYLVSNQNSTKRYKTFENFESYVNQHRVQRLVNGKMRDIYNVLEVRMNKKNKKIQDNLSLDLANLIQTINQCSAHSLILSKEISLPSTYIKKPSIKI